LYKQKKQKLERDLERYRALLKLATDQRALAGLKQLCDGPGCLDSFRGGIS